jgi:F0F1-type ATP synthase epsilon subunit
VNVHLRVVIRTPQGSVLEAAVLAVRVPTETGQVGLRPRQEPLLLVVEPGLVVLRTADGARFVATAGGLLDAGRERCVLFTPFAVAGDDEADVLAALDRALAAPDGEIATRRQLAELEERIAQESRKRSAVGRAGAERG